MARSWGRIARHYLASLGSYLFKIPYTIYKGIKSVYHLAKREFDKAAYNLGASLVHFFLFPLYSLYRFVEGTYDLLTGRSFPWYK